MADDKTFTQAEVDAMIADANKGIEANRNKAMDQLKEAERKLRAYDGVDVTEYRALKDKVTELEHKAKAEKAGLTSDELAKLRSDVTADVERRYAQDMGSALRVFPWAQSLASENRSLKLDSVVKAEMAKGGARAERIDALFRLTSDRYDLTEDGKPMLKVSPGLEISKYVAQDLAREYPEFYNGSGSSGGGASKSTAGGGGPNTIAAGDNKAFIDNLADIAKGKVKVG